MQLLWRDSAARDYAPTRSFIGSRVKAGARAAGTPRWAYKHPRHTQSACIARRRRSRNSSPRRCDRGTTAGRWLPGRRRELRRSSAPAMQRRMLSGTSGSKSCRLSERWPSTGLNSFRSLHANLCQPGCQANPRLIRCADSKKMKDGMCDSAHSPCEFPATITAGNPVRGEG